MEIRIDIPARQHDDSTLPAIDLPGDHSRKRSRPARLHNQPVLVPGEADRRLHLLVADGEGARLATIFPTPTVDDVTARIEEKVYGIGPGEFAIDDPVVCPGFMILNVTYTQPTDLLLFPGPTITVARSKRVWVASEDFGVEDEEEEEVVVEPVEGEEAEPEADPCA